MSHRHLIPHTLSLHCWSSWICKMTKSQGWEGAFGPFWAPKVAWGCSNFGIPNFGSHLVLLKIILTIFRLNVSSTYCVDWGHPMHVYQFYHTFFNPDPMLVCWLSWDQQNWVCWVFFVNWRQTALRVSLFYFLRHLCTVRDVQYIDDTVLSVRLKFVSDNVKQGSPTGVLSLFWLKINVTKIQEITWSWYDY